MIHVTEEGRPAAPLQLRTFNKFPLEERRAHALAALRRGLPDVRTHEGRFAGKPAAVVGAGPSVEASLETLRQWRGPVVACEKIAALLAGAGVDPDYVVALDASDDVARSILAGPPDATYLMALQCAPSAFDALGDRAAAVFMNMMEDVDVDELLELADVTIVNAGGSVTIACAALSIILGCREIEVFGFDCHIGDGLYARGATGVGVEASVVPATVAGRVWHTTWAYMEFARQMLELRALGRKIGAIDDLRIHGDSFACAISQEDVRARP